jgi:AAT family amino acid transporter
MSHTSKGESVSQVATVKPQQGLAERHLTLLALGSCIGVGLFLGSAKAIQLAGPAILVGYVAGGLVLLVIMRALGELTLASPTPASFVGHANTYISPLVAYLTGWLYWAMWIVTCVAEISAVAVYMKVWFPETTGWIWSLAALIFMGSVNLVATRIFGEFEFWFALIKVIVIVALIAAGLGMICFGWGVGGSPVGVSNLWSHGGFAPNGITGVLLAMQMVMFAYLGVEMLGLAAADADQPERTVPRAFGSVFRRILIFYVGALFVILSLYPWNQIGTTGSPFVLTFDRLGVPAAAGIINFVVITAALSSCSGGIFSTGRMLYGMAYEGRAPSAFAKATAKGVPQRAVVVSLAALLFGGLPQLSRTGKDLLLGHGSCDVRGGMDLVCHSDRSSALSRLAFRRCRRALQYPLFLSPLTNYVGLLFLGGILVLLALSPDTRPALIVGPIFIVLLAAAYPRFRRRVHHGAGPERV